MKKRDETTARSQSFVLSGETGYFQNGGVNVMLFDDFYPEGHQSGVSIIMHGNRVASGGDIRFEKPLKDWRPVSKPGERTLDETANTIAAAMTFPGASRHSDGSNPVDPSLIMDYTVTVKGEGASVIVTVDLDKPIPDAFAGNVCFQLELFPGALYGLPWMMDGKQGIFPRQLNGPVYTESGAVMEPYAVGKRFTVRPDDPYNRLVIETEGEPLKLYDGRVGRNSGWFVVSASVPSGVTKNALRWVITPNVVADWVYTPIVQASQVGYHPDQPKVAVIELDKNDTRTVRPTLHRITETGEQLVYDADALPWGQFLRYNYVKFDFSDIKDEGLYRIRYGASESPIFRIAGDVYDRGVWQPVLEYFLPVQMCHMRVVERSRVWHDLCHMDDALMAPVDHKHFDGYEQGPSTLTSYKPGDEVPGLDIGGWHDAGDDDLRVESQAGECYILAMAYESFGVDYDTTTVDQATRIVEMLKPDGKNDILQQIEHGALSVVGAYRSLGRLYRGIISNNMEQYTIMGDWAVMSKGIKGDDDDRWVFTEDNPARELRSAAQLAAVARVLRGFNDELSAQSLQAARALFAVTRLKGEAVEIERAKAAKVHAAAELLLTTGEAEYKQYLISETDFIVSAIDAVGWAVARADKAVGEASFSQAIRGALPGLRARLAEQSAETPYGIPYRPHIWGAGWGIQRMAFEYYYLHEAYPDIFEPNMVFDALNFVLGCHPGSNNMSFASGVGANSATVAYGFNRADWSFIPGGVISGTALIRPDFPELLVFPYLWQQTEYVMGGGSSHYMFLALAAQHILCTH